MLDVPFEVLAERVTGRRLDPETGTIYHLKTKLPYKRDEAGNILQEPLMQDDGNGGKFRRGGAQSAFVGSAVHAQR